VQGAATTVYACVAEDIPSGAYLESCAVVAPGASALDEALGKQLFDKTEELIAAAVGKSEGNGTVTINLIAAVSGVKQ
jgi:hypothetical protein